MGTSRGKRHDIEHIGLHWIHTFRVNFLRGGQGTRDRGQWEQVEVRDTATASNTLDSIGYRPLGLLSLGGKRTGDRGQGTGERGTSRGKRHDIEHIGLHGTQTFRVNSFRGGQGDRGLGTGKRIQHFMILSCQHSGARGGQDLDTLEQE